MRDKWKTYARYKALNRLPESPVLQSLEELIQQTDLYDTLEFSHKHVKRNGRYHFNPLRLSLYRTDSRINFSLFEDGFRLLREILKGMKGASDFKKLKAGTDGPRSEIISLRCSRMAPLYQNKTPSFGGFEDMNLA